MNITVKPGEKLNVLVVDDEGEIRETLITFLESMDIFSTIIEASDGAEAMRKCQNQQFDVIITDLMMPKVRGVEFIINYRDFVRRNKIEEKSPIAILSANLTSAEVKKALSFGVKYLLAKPCSIEDFINKITEILVKERRDKLKVTK